MTRPFRIDWSGRALEYTPDEIQTVVEVMRSADPLTQGRHLLAFEKKFSEYNQTPHCFAVSTGASALELTALLCRIGKGDEVILPAHTYCATAIPFARTGAKLVWADIHPGTRLISAHSICANLSPRTKVIVAVHLNGLMAEMDQISTLARQHGSLLVEDCAQSLGAEFRGRKAGTFGDFAIFSFHAQKNMTTLGEGGMLCVRSPRHAEQVPGLRHNGHVSFSPDRQHYWLPAMTNVDLDLEGVWPYNFSLGEAQCALGCKLLERIDALNQIRIERALRFRAALREFSELGFQETPPDCKHVYHLLAARYDGTAWGAHRDDLIEILSRRHAIKAIVQYYPLYRYPLFVKMGFGEHHCPHTDHYFDHMVSFPFHLWMTDRDFDYLTDCTIQTLKELRAGQCLNPEPILTDQQLVSC